MYCLYNKVKTFYFFYWKLRFSPAPSPFLQTYFFSFGVTTFLVFVFLHISHNPFFPLFLKFLSLWNNCLGTFYIPLVFISYSLLQPLFTLSNALCIALNISWKLTDCISGRSVIYELKVLGYNSDSAPKNMPLGECGRQTLKVTLWPPPADDHTFVWALLLECRQVYDLLFINKGQPGNGLYEVAYFHCVILQYSPGLEFSLSWHLINLEVSSVLVNLRWRATLDDIFVASTSHPKLQT